MKQATQQKILKEVNQELANLSEWLQGLGVSEADVVSHHDAAMRENGMMAEIVLNLTRNVLPVNDARNINTVQAKQVLAWVRSEEFASGLLALPEPTSKELEQTLTMLKDGLANLRRHFLNSGELGPRYRRGGRKKIKKLDDPAVRQEIRETIKSLRSSENTLEELFKRMGDKYGVSAATIKRRVWLEKMSTKQPLLSDTLD